MIIAEFFIPGVPVAKGRPKFFRRGNFVGTYTPEKTEAYESNLYAFVARYAQEKKITPIGGPISIRATFFMPRQKSHTAKQRISPWHVSRPDTDNMVKALLDAINGIFFNDDSQVCSEYSAKIYATETQLPGIHLTIEDLAS